MNFTIRPVVKKDYRFLYNLLKTRCSTWNISHKTMPSYKEHCEFNDKKPYRVDFVIYDSNEKIGRIYITNKQEVGIYALSKQVVIEVLEEVLGFAVDNKLNLFFNVSPNNKLLNNYFRKKGLKPIQYTYRYL